MFRTILRPVLFQAIKQHEIRRFCGISNSLKLEFYLRNWDDLYEHRHTKKLEQALRLAVSSPIKVRAYKIDQIAKMDIPNRKSR